MPEDTFSWRPSAVIQLDGFLLCHLDQMTGTWTATGVGLTALFVISSHLRWLLVLGMAWGPRFRDLGRRYQLVFAGSLLAGLETRTSRERWVEFLLILRIEEGFSFPFQSWDPFILGLPSLGLDQDFQRPQSSWLTSGLLVPKCSDWKSIDVT